MKGEPSSSKVPCMLVGWGARKGHMLLWVQAVQAVPFSPTQHLHHAPFP